jgi:hypothetical protein
LIGFLLSAGITTAIGTSLVADHGRRVIPWLCATAVALGILFGWAITGFIAYVQLSATTRQ